jgi:hypothetical protein
MKNQNDKILARLKRGPLTPLQALGEIGCFRLAARVNDLRELGHAIDSKRVRTVSGKCVSEYRLAREAK